MESYIQCKKIFLFLTLCEKKNPTGVRETGRACCEMSRSSSGVLCKKQGPVCRDRTEYVFFDGLHPTDAVNARIARKGYGSSSPEHAYPINVKKLAML